MSATPFELSGKYKSTTGGNVDWYFGGGDIAWASIAAAEAGIPNVGTPNLRADRVFGVLENGVVVRYKWEANNTANGAHVPFSTGGGGMTDAEVKTAYENNANTNAFEDDEKAKLATVSGGATANSTDAQLRDRSTHTGTQTASTISDFSTESYSKISDKYDVWQANETFTSEMGTVVKIGSNNLLYKLSSSVVRPFTTIDLFAESNENPAKWDVLGASFPPFSLTSISRTQLSPNTTLDIEIRGLLITGVETITIGGSIVTINNISFVKVDGEVVMIVNITTPATLHSDLPIIVDNGTPVTLSETFTISNGVEYIPSLTSSEAPFVVNSGDQNDLIFGVGSVRNLNGVAGTKVIKIDLDIPTNMDFIFEFTSSTNNNGETSEGDLGLSNKNAPATNRATLRYGLYLQGPNHTYVSNLGSSNQITGGGTGGDYMIKGTLNNSNLYDIQWFQNSVLKFTLSNQQPDEILNVFIMTNSLTTHENIKVTLI